MECPSRHPNLRDERGVALLLALLLALLVAGLAIGVLLALLVRQTFFNDRDD